MNKRKTSIKTVKEALRELERSAKGKGQHKHPKTKA
jgi:hypothetical protein